MNTQKAIPYARIATAQTADPSQAIENQMNAINQYCIENNIEVAGSFYDIAGGHNFERTGFTEMMDYVRQHEGSVNLILVTNWDRFSRNYPQTIIMEQQLTSMGIKLIAVAQSQVSSFSEFIAQEYKNYIHVHS